MEVKNAVMPNEEQLKGFNDQEEDKPIFMVNLLKFKEKAQYPDKRETDLSGEEAYAIYGEEVVGHLAKVGGKPIFGGNVDRLMLGEVEDLKSGLKDTVKAIAEELELKPALINKAISVAHKGNYQNIADDMDTLESILNTAGKL